MVLYNFETLRAFKLSGMVLGWTIISALILIGFSAFTLVVFKRTNDKAVTGSYSAMLLIATLGYLYIAMKAPKIRGMPTDVQLCLDSAAEEFHRQCTSITGMSDF